MRWIDIAGWTMAGLAWAVLITSGIIALASRRAPSPHDLAAGTSAQGVTSIAA